jgi:hypothetical protein
VGLDSNLVPVTYKSALDFSLVFSDLTGKDSFLLCSLHYDAHPIPPLHTVINGRVEFGEMKCEGVSVLDSSGLG